MAANGGHVLCGWHLKCDLTRRVTAKDRDPLGRFGDYLEVHDRAARTRVRRGAVSFTPGRQHMRSWGRMAAASLRPLVPPLPLALLALPHTHTHTRAAASRHIPQPCVRGRDGRFAARLAARSTRTCCSTSSTRRHPPSSSTRCSHSCSQCSCSSDCSIAMLWLVQRRGHGQPPSRDSRARCRQRRALDG